MAGVSAYAFAIAGVAVATLLTTVVLDWVAPSVSLLFFPAVIVAALYGGYRAALVSTVLSTASLAYFFVPPAGSFDIGIDDGIRLGVFAGVALITSSLGSSRKRAEDALRRSLDELRDLHTVLQRVREWPSAGGDDVASGMRVMLQHAARVVGCHDVVIAWEDEEEPRLCLARSAASAEVLTYHSPDSLLPLVAPALVGESFLCENAHDETFIDPKLWPYLDAGSVGSASFETEHLHGRVFFSGTADVTSAALPRIELVAREIGTSLEHVRAGERLRLLAIRDERTRVARDLHDGMLQALSGVRLELQTLRRGAVDVTVSQRLDLVDDVLAREQHDLRRLIQDTRLMPTPVRETPTPLHTLLNDFVRRVNIEWRAAVDLHVTPHTLAVSAPTGRALQLMVHEGIVNALKHGRPSRVSVTVNAIDAGIRVAIDDDGSGFPFEGRLDHAALAARGVGPATLRERAEALGGSIAVESRSTGAHVEFTIPVSDRTETYDVSI